MLPSKLFFPFTLMEEPPVLLSIQEMVLLILFLFMKVSLSLMLSRRTSLLVELSLPIWLISSLLMESKKLEENPLGLKLLEKSRKISALSLLTLLQIRPRLLSPLKSKRLMSFLMDKLSTSTLQDSWPQRLFSTQDLSKRVTRPLVCTPWLLEHAKNVILILEKTYTQIPSFQEELLFTRVSQIDSRKSSMPCAHNKTWSR